MSKIRRIVHLRRDDVRARENRLELHVQLRVHLSERRNPSARLLHEPTRRVRLVREEGRNAPG